MHTNKEPYKPEIRENFLYMNCLGLKIAKITCSTVLHVSVCIYELPLKCYFSHPKWFSIKITSAKIIKLIQQQYIQSFA